MMKNQNKKSNRQTYTDSKQLMDISQQTGSKRKSVSEIKNIFCANSAHFPI